jgi:secondary thiamine-phosphate synthase enzyme
MVLENHSFATTTTSDFIDLTDDLLDLVARSEVSDGIALVYSPHTTGAILINERERGFLRDFGEMLERLAPSDVSYAHDDEELRIENLDPEHTIPNGHAHCRHALMGSASQAIPIVGGHLELGRWQRVFFLECDRARERRVLLQVLGE